MIRRFFDELLGNVDIETREKAEAHLPDLARTHRPGRKLWAPEGSNQPLTSSATTMRVAIAFARNNAVSRMITGATAVAMKASKSLRMCWNQTDHYQELN